MENVLRGRHAIAEYLDVSWPTVRKMIREDGLPVTKLGKEFVSSPEAIDAWLEKRVTAKLEN